MKALSKQKHSKKTKALDPGAGAFKLRDAAKYLGGVSEITIRRLIERGQLKPNRSIRHILLSKAELDRFLVEGQS
jgi:excisionase family DNA binding protein